MFISLLHTYLRLEQQQELYLVYSYKYPPIKDEQSQFLAQQLASYVTLDI